jgi:hypothetical protein
LVAAHQQDWRSAFFDQKWTNDLSYQMISQSRTEQDLMSFGRANGQSALEFERPTASVENQ